MGQGTGWQQLDSIVMPSQVYKTQTFYEHRWESSHGIDDVSTGLFMSVLVLVLVCMPVRGLLGLKLLQNLAQEEFFQDLPKALRYEIFLDLNQTMIKTVPFFQRVIELSPGAPLQRRSVLMAAIRCAAVLCIALCQFVCMVFGWCVCACVCFECV